MPGALVISLDFELQWGVRDRMPLPRYGANLLGVREAVPAILGLFRRRSIAATWATVGFLFAERKEQIERAMPAELPTYTDPALSPYPDLARIGPDEARDPFHYAASLVRLVASTPRQELGTHTFSHFYCLEPGQTAAQFEADLAAAAAIGEDLGDVTRALVFPRNQVNPAYLPVLARRGVRAVRSNGPHPVHRPRRGRDPQAVRAARLLDAYLRLPGPRAAGARRVGDGVVEVPASAFLRPWKRRLRHLEGLRLRRLAGELEAAARDDAVVHLWWHPHNFGVDLGENLRFLERVLDRFAELRATRGMESLTMTEAAALAGC